jgi:hypothetical protein
MKRRTVLLIASLIPPLVRPAVAPAQATHTSFQFQSHFSGLAPRFCLPEDVQIETDITTTFTFTANANGGFQTSQQIRAKGTGVGVSSGINYRFNSGSYSESNTSSDPCQFETTFLEHSILISQGGSDNLRLHTTVHATMNPNCELTAQVENVAISCQE